MQPAMARKSRSVFSLLMVLYAYPQACPDRFSIRFAAAEPDDRTRTATCRARPAPAGWVRPPPERLRPRGSGSHPKAEGYFCEKAFNFITKVTFFSDFLIIFSSRPVPEYSRSANASKQAGFRSWLIRILALPKILPARQNASKQVFVLDLFVSLKEDRLRFGIAQIDLAMPSPCTIFGFAQDTLARQKASKFLFSTYSYLWLRPRYSRSAKCKQACFCPRLFELWLAPKILRLGIIKLMLASALDFSYL